MLECSGFKSNGDMMSVEKDINVVIIDDNEMTREILRVTLRADGYQVVGEATDGETGLELVKRTRPDVIFLDVIMPRISGLEVLKQIRQILPRCAVLMVTGQNDRSTVHAALQNGASGIILKPFNTGTVISTVEGALQRMKNS